MCLKLDEQRKALPAVGFPEGWRFLFGPIHNNFYFKNVKQYKGLALLAPNGRRYYTAERAINHNPSTLRDADPWAFYAGVGLNVQGDAASISSTDRSSCPAPEGKKRRAYSDRCEVGARVYAMFDNEQWYWGKITKVSGKARFLKCSVSSHCSREVI